MDKQYNAFLAAVKSVNTTAVEKCLAKYPALVRHSAYTICDLPYTRVTDTILVHVFRQPLNLITSFVETATAYNRFDIVEKALCLARARDIPLDLHDAYDNACHKGFTKVATLIEKHLQNTML